MTSDMEDLVTSSFGGLLAERHPPSYARRALAVEAEPQRALWEALADAGWLEAGCGEFRRENASCTLLLGELAGRSLLTLPYGASAFLLAPLCELCPEPLRSGVVRDLGSAPASVLCVSGAGGERLIDRCGDGAQYLVLEAPGAEAEWTLRAYDASAIVALDGLDPCMGLGRIEGEAARSCAVPAPAAREALRIYQVFAMAETLGAAAASLDAAIGYAKERRQFGRPIGQFQAVKHALANAWIGLDNGRYALRDLCEREPTEADASARLRLADRLVTEAAKQACKLAIQVHGGLGFAWESDAQLYLKRVYRGAVRTRQALDALGRDAS